MEDFGYNADSVSWVDGFVERQRLRSDMAEPEIDQLIQNLACYVGECVRACYGGEWQRQDGSWVVAFDASNAVFPFNKVRKQFENGAEDSIDSWFNTIPVVFAQLVQPQSSKKQKPWWKRL